MSVGTDELTESQSRWSWSSWLPTWCPTSPSHLRTAEERILRPISVPFSRRYVSLSSGERLWTLAFSPPGGSGSGSPPVPLVLLHGCGAAVGLWVQNLSALARDRPVFALDLLGFGRSSRAAFGRDAEEAEERFVEALEEWRRAEQLEQIILLGHHLGGYVCTAYALRHPHRLKQLLLVEPWGFSARPDVDVRGVPLWIRALGAAMNPFTPLGPLRLAGPLGPLLLRLLRSDLKQKYGSVFSDDTVLEYIYHINTQTASGEWAFMKMSVPYGWPRRPLLERVERISPDLPMTFIYGSRSSIDGQSGHAVAELRPASHTTVIVIQGAGHYVFADQPDDFNQTVRKICQNTGDDRRTEERRD